MLNSHRSAMCLFNKVLPLDSTLVSGTRELWLHRGVKPPRSIHLAKVYFIKMPPCYFIQQKSLQHKSSLQRVIIIRLIGLNVLKPEVKWQALLSLFACAGEVDMCAEAGAWRPGPLSFLFSYQRPHTYQFQISQEQRERETTDRKGIFFHSFFFFSFSEVNRMSAPLTFHRGKQLFITLAQQTERPTWQPSDSNELKCWCHN